MDLEHDGSRIKVPTELILEQEKGEMRARLTVYAGAIEEISIRVSEL